MQVRTDIIEQFGGLEALQARVVAFRYALEEHSHTVDVSAPVEVDLVETLARSGEVIEPVEPPVTPGSEGATNAALMTMNLAIGGLGLKVIELEERVRKLEVGV